MAIKQEKFTSSSIYTQDAANGADAGNAKTALQDRRVFLAGVSLSVGDIILLPTESTLDKFLFQTLISDELRPYVGTLLNGAPYRLFPSVFDRMVIPYIKDDGGNLVRNGKAHYCMGEPVDVFKGENNAYEGLKALAKRFTKGIKVTSVEVISTRNFDRTDVTDQAVFTFEGVE